MALARFKDLCVDAETPARLGAFWAAWRASRRWVPRSLSLSTARAAGLLWPTRKAASSARSCAILTMDFVPVPEPKTAKNRIHWDVVVPSVAPLVGAGARVLREPGGDIGWYVLADPEENEFCAFIEQPTAR